MSEKTMIGIIGSGTMGRGIAHIAAQRADHRVLLYDIDQKILSEAIDRIKHFLDRAVEKGKMSADEAGGILQRISTTTTLSDLSNSEFVIEAAPEILDLKRGLFSELSGIVSEYAILATNTSTLSVTEIATAAINPARVVGMHFFNPPPLMPLVEVISGSETSPQVMDATVALSEAMGKIPVRVQDVPGFIVNRVARPYYLETLRLMEQGVADAATLDRLLREGGGFRMGPFELMDLIGLDINYAASQSVYNAYFQPARLRPSILQSKMVASGRLGRKTGRGWYDYDKGEE